VTTCSEIRDLLLEATPAELRGEGEGTLAAHLRSCEACRRRAELLLRADEALEAALGEGGVPDVEAILELAGQPASERARPAGFRAKVRSLLPAPRHWIPLAAAAALAGVLLLARNGEPPALPPVARAQAQALPTVEAASAAGVAIVETDNPNITVLWFFEQGT
jgi:hypothetical protein